MGQNKLAYALSLCRRAGKLVCGTDAVQEAVSKGNVYTVFLCSDTAQRTERQIRFSCKDKPVSVKRCGATMESLSAVLGKPYGVIGICDEQLSKLAEKSEMEGLHI